MLSRAQNKAVKGTSRLKTGNYASEYKPLQRNGDILGDKTKQI